MTSPVAIQIRQSVFETNSSSSHSLAIGDSKVKLSFSKATLRRKEFNITPREFGWEWRRYYKPENKIEYVFASLYDNGRGTRDLATLGKWFRKLSDICAKNGVDLKFPYRTKNMSDEDRPLYASIDFIEKELKFEFNFDSFSCGVDHDSEGLVRSVFRDLEKLEDFLFDRNAYVETSNDNSFEFKDGTPASFEAAMIETDFGDEKYGETGPRADWVANTIVSWNEYQRRQSMRMT